MNLETAYSVINISVMPAWILLTFAPHWKWTNKLVQAAFISLLLAIVYAYFVGWGMFFGGAEAGAGMGSLKQVMILFDSPISMLAGWTHYLAFDLFVGMWIVRDGQRQNIGPYWRAPCLLFTFLFGPIGLAMYLIFRWVQCKKISLYEQY